MGCLLSFLFVGLKTLGTFINDNWLVHEVECPNVSTTNRNLQKGNFVYNLLTCKSIYRPLSYPYDHGIATVIKITIKMSNTQNFCIKEQNKC